MTGGRNILADLDTTTVSNAHHSIDPANTPAAKVTAWDTNATDATAAKIPAKKIIVGGLASVRPYAVTNERPGDCVTFA